MWSQVKTWFAAPFHPRVETVPCTASNREPLARHRMQNDQDEASIKGQLVPYRRATGSSFDPQKEHGKRISESSDSQWSSKAIKKHQRPETAATQFVQWLQSEGYSGEYRWIDLWRMYRLDYCRQANAQPLAPNYQHLFAQQLGHLCQRDYYREVINGKRRFYRTYHIRPLATEMATRVEAA